EQQANRLNQAHGEVSPGCRETAILLARRPRSESRKSLTAFKYGVFGRDRFFFDIPLESVVLRAIR
ncbi:MAG: hypothetical protein WCL32_23845, partial [Planctomycetota bacterium]